jgi:uncharacterized Zn-binding protein involved in type VI secretion
MGTAIARLGDTSSHGGTIITAASKTLCEGKPVARVTDMLDCPLPGHGVNPIVTGSPHYLVEGQQCARTGSVTACGATIIGGASKSVCG